MFFFTILHCVKVFNIQFYVSVHVFVRLRKFEYLSQQITESPSVLLEADNYECSLTYVAVFVRRSRDQYLNFLQFLLSFQTIFYHTEQM